MSPDLKNILSKFSSEVDQQTLLKYLEGKLSEQQKHEVEKQMLDSEFEQDALEGLEQVRQKEKLASLVEQMNRDLKKKVEKKKRLRDKWRYKDQPWIYIAVLIVLLLAIISFIILRLMMKP